MGGRDERASEGVESCAYSRSQVVVEEARPSAVQSVLSSLHAPTMTLPVTLPMSRDDLRLTHLTRERLRSQ